MTRAPKGKKVPMYSPDKGKWLAADVTAKPSAVVAQIGGSHYSKCAGLCPSCGQEIQHWDLFARLPYLEAQVCRYLMRWLEKNGLEDLDKAQSFLTKLRGVLRLEEHRTAQQFVSKTQK